MPAAPAKAIDTKPVCGKAGVLFLVALLGKQIMEEFERIAQLSDANTQLMYPFGAQLVCRPSALSNVLISSTQLPAGIALYGCQVATFLVR